MKASYKNSLRLPSDIVALLDGKPEVDHHNNVTIVTFKDGTILTGDASQSITEILHMNADMVEKCRKLGAATIKSKRKADEKARKEAQSDTQAKAEALRIKQYGQLWTMFETAQYKYEMDTNYYQSTGVEGNWSDPYLDAKVMYDLAREIAKEQTWFSFEDAMNVLDYRIQQSLADNAA
jgi:hypothetical protein